MKTKKPHDYFKDVITILQELKKLQPTSTLGTHIATALDDYGDIWGLTDKELVFAFTKYKAQMEMDFPRETEEEEIQKIIEDGMNLSIHDFEEDE